MVVKRGRTARDGQEEGRGRRRLVGEGEGGGLWRKEREEGERREDKGGRKRENEIGN